MGAVWFTSDLHLGHRFVAGLRGFDAPENHDEVLSQNWRKVVKPDDQVWVLGDVVLGDRRAGLALLSSLPGEKHLIAGNHDNCHPMHRNAHRQQALYLTAFATIQMAARRKIAGEYVLLSHFPHDRDRGETRYAQWRLPDEGLWLMHGHTHGQERLTGREIHVGVDAWDLSPVHVSTIERLIKGEQ